MGAQAADWKRELWQGTATEELPWSLPSNTFLKSHIRYQLGCLQSQHIGRVPAAPHLALPPQQGTLLGSISRFGQPAGGGLNVGQNSPEVPLRTVAL